ncbi:DUF2157 domain-containing protein [Campylobacter sp. 19-13652]|uniref:DUF2157 domain-containing protein n=1 Tax=Campylobacter sp. 19-13652 TaxID=2840180 RepID=UPI001C785AF1|nr:DUF2157 domain-containing protein [Campylobacter sp. 19-13652]BCX80124.1 hypothetical protein LBC_15860 [Campylobacter sp. 19-13652]
MNNFKFMQNQIKIWQNEGLIDENLAAKLKSRYESPSRLYLAVRIIASLFAFGAALLFIAHNWDEMALLARFGVVLAVLAGVQGVGLFCLRREQILLARAWLFLANLLFGAALTLVAQIFNLGEHMSDGVLVWAVAPLAFGAIFGWTEQVALSLVLAGVYMGMEFMIYDSFSPAWSVFLAVGAFWYFKGRSGWLGAFVGAFLNFIFALYSYHTFGDLTQATLLYLAASLFLALVFYGSAIGQVSAIVGTFVAFLWQFFASFDNYALFNNVGKEPFWWAILLVLCAASVAIALKKRRWILGASALYLLALGFGASRWLSPLAIGGINILLFVLIGLKAIMTKGKLNIYLGAKLILAVAVSEYLTLRYGYLGTSLIFLAVAGAVLVLFRRAK